MADVLKPFYNACNPLKPAGPDFYVDADDVRGSRDFSKQFLLDLKNIEDDFLTYIFTGHLGCGKSSELRHLAEQLKRPDPKLMTSCYFPIILDAEEFIDSYDVTPTDVLLSVLARAAQEFKGIGIDLQDSFLWRRITKAGDFLKDELFSEIEIPSDQNATLPLGLVTANFRLLKSDPTNRQIIRDALGHDTSTLKGEIKKQFEAARGKLGAVKGANGKPYKDFVLILDNLEKIGRVKDQADGYQSHRQFFISTRYTALRCNACRRRSRVAPATGQTRLSIPFALPSGAERLTDALHRGSGATRRI